MVLCPGCGEENPAKFRLCGYCGAALAGPGSAPAPAALPAHDVRKTVTIVFTDLKDSTALGEHLDPEALRDVMTRYFAAMSAEITRHGGKIEKFIGDAIMAVFGLPRAHEDDALRAVRSAVGMRTALLRVNDDLMRHYGVTLANRCGVNTGEVVASDNPADDQKLATGDAVNVAARLEQAAGRNEILLGESTYRLVRDAVEVEPMAPLELKGKTERVAAYRLLAAEGQMGSARRHDTPIVGREAELAVLAGVYREVCDAAAARLVTVIGDAGVGKSRLVYETLERVGPGVRVLLGRCLPYGDGITFWPLREMVSAAADIRADDSPEAARAKLVALVADVDVADRLAAATGLSPAPFPLPELYWAARKFFEAVAATGPLVALIDDIHWAEPAFLDLLEERPEWSERPGATRLVLAPLSDTASAQVVGNLVGATGLPAEVIERIVAAAEGNPLFVEQMLSMLIDTRALRKEDGRWVRGERYAEIAIPPTIQALLEARLDRLARSERATVEPAAVIGVQFALPAVAALAPEAARASIDEHLAELTRKQFIQPTAAPTADADVVFRFHHHLVRETVYGGLLKRSRAAMHIDFVRWADRVNAERGRALEFEEVLGYHLEQAHRYLAELGLLDATGIAIGVDAATRLAGAGRRALARGDLYAAANLLQRAAARLAPDAPQRTELLPELGETLMGLGDFAGARAVLAEARVAADRIANQRIKASSQVVGMLMRLYSGEPGDWSKDTLSTAHGLIPVLERESAHHELATTWRLIGLVHGIAGRYSLASEGAERSTAHARLAGNVRLVERNAAILSMNALYGPMPVLQAIVECEQQIAGGLSDRQIECTVMGAVAQLKAMNGELEAARGLYRRSRALLRDLGQGVFAASTGLGLARVELHGGDLSIAESEVRADYEFLASKGETYFLSTMAALLSRVVRDQGRDAEALDLSEKAEAATAADDIESQALWRSIRAPIVARAGNTALAESLARTALEIVRRTEAPVLQADALAELAWVLRLAGKTDEARHVIEEAIALYTSKGNVVSAARARAWAGELGST